MYLEPDLSSYDQNQFDFTILNSKFENCVSGIYGGAITFVGGNSLIENSVFSKNVANHGGAIVLFCNSFDQCDL